MRRASLLVVLFLAACSSSSPSNPDGGAPLGPDSGPGPSVELISPVTGITVGPHALQLVGAADGGTPTTFAFWVDGAPIETLSSPPWQTTWDATSATAGLHALTIHATFVGGKSVVSAPDYVTIDNAPPQVQTVSPPTTETVCLSDALSFGFSERLAPASVTADSAIAVSYTDAGVISASSTLSADFQNLTTSLAPAGPLYPVYTGTLTATASGAITDLVGNPLQPFQATWQVDPWCRVRDPLTNFSLTDLSYLSIAVGADGNPVVAGLRNNGVHTDVWVYRFDGAHWSPVGGAINPLPTHNASDLGTSSGANDIPVGLAIDSAGNPWIAFYENNGSEFVLWVMRWNGAQWSVVDAAIDPQNVWGSGLAIDDGTFPFAHVAFALDSHDVPYVAVSPIPTTGGHTYVQVFNDTGGGWTQVGGNLSQDPAFSVGDRLIALDSSDQPTVAFLQRVTTTPLSPYVATFPSGATAWTVRASSSSANMTGKPIDGFDLAIDTDGTVYLAEVERDSSGNTESVEIAKLAPAGSSWVHAATLNPTVPASGFVGFGTSIRARDGHVVVLFTGPYASSGAAFIGYLNGGSWSLMPQPLTAFTGSINTDSTPMAMDANHLPVSALSEYNTQNGNGIEVLRWFDPAFYP